MEFKFYRIAQSWKQLIAVGSTRSKYSSSSSSGGGVLDDDGESSDFVASRWNDSRLFLHASCVWEIKEKIGYRVFLLLVDLQTTRGRRASTDRFSRRTHTRKNNENKAKKKILKAIEEGDERNSNNNN